MAPKAKSQTIERRKQLTVRMPDEIHRKLKAKCALEGKPVGDVVLDLIKKHVEGR